MQLLWRLSSSSTLLCFALFFVLVKISEILNIGQILLSVCFVSKSIKTKNLIFSHHVIDQQTVNKLMLSCATKLAVPSRWETKLTLSGANQNGLKIHFISSCHIVSHYRAFSFTWPASMQIYGSKRNCLHKKSPTATGSVWNSNISVVSLFWNKHQHGCLDVMWKRSKVVYYMAERWSESCILIGYPSLLGISCVGPATKSSFFGHMKGQARNVWRGTQTTRRHFCLLFFCWTFP